MGCGGSSSGPHLFQTAAPTVQAGGRPESGKREVQAVGRYLEGEHLRSFAQKGCQCNLVTFACCQPRSASRLPDFRQLSVVTSVWSPQCG